MKSRPVFLVTAALLAGALALAAPAAAGAASPAKGGHGSTTTTTTTKPGSAGGQASAFATLVIKPASVGHVSVETAGTTTFQPGTNNEQLHVGDTVQTDSVGLAEIDYASNAYTRLNVNTTFTIKKLTDSQGNRQIDGGLTSGETWNRTAELTQSESFTQDGGGVTAAVSGTAFVVNCTTSTQCTFTAVIDNTNLTGPNGQTETLNPLTQCVTQNSALCASPTMLTPDQLALIQWIQYNVLLDFTEHGIGNGIFDPFGGTVNVTNGVVTAFTPSGPNQGFTPSTPSTPPTPPTPPTIDPSDSVCIGASLSTCTATSAATGFNTISDDSPPLESGAVDGSQVFFLTGSSNTTAFVFDSLPLDTLAVITYLLHATPTEVSTGQQYAASTQFTLAPTDGHAPSPNPPATGPDTGSTSFTFTAVNSAGSSPVSNPVNVTVNSDDGGGGRPCGDECP